MRRYDGGVDERLDERAGTIGGWQRVSRRVAYENPWVTIWHDEVTRPDGAPGIYGVVHFANVAVGVVAIDGEDRIALVEQDRYPFGRRSLEIPEGGSPHGESPLEGARRELREETGLDAAAWRELGRADLSNSVTDETAVIYLATGLTAGQASPEGTEDLELSWLPFSEALAMTRDGRITDAISIIGIQWAAAERADVGSR